MITVDFSKRGKTGLCDYLYETIKSQILSGILVAGEKLPSKRALADHLGISVITVQNAYSLLQVEGYITSIEKKGFFVNDIKNDTVQFSSESVQFPTEVQPASQWRADFSSSATSFEKFPFSLWSKTMRHVLSTRDKNLLQKTDTKGIFELRHAIAHHLRDFRNMSVSEEQIIIGSGSESLYTTLIQLLGTEHCYAVENPGYKKISAVFELNKAQWQAGDIDGEGMNPESLKKIGATVAHVSPSHHFPTGIVMSVRRRNELLLWANQAENRYIIEDDYDSEFRFHGKPLPTLQSADKNGKVIYINTFTKTLAPSFRISYMVLPKQLVRKFEVKFDNFSSPVSAFEQLTLAQFISDGNFARHINRMKNYYRSLRNELIEAFSNNELSKIIHIQEEESGLHFLLSLHDKNLDIQKINNQLLKNKIRLPLLKDFYYSDIPPEKKNTFVVNYSGIQKGTVSDFIGIIFKCLQSVAEPI